MNSEDILLWPDGFWCFREEFDREFMRADDFECSCARAMNGPN